MSFQSFGVVSVKCSFTRDESIVSILPPTVSDLQVSTYTVCTHAQFNLHLPCNLINIIPYNPQLSLFAECNKSIICLQKWVHYQFKAQVNVKENPKHIKFTNQFKRCQYIPFVVSYY